MPISLKNTAPILSYARYSPQANSMTIACADSKPRTVEFIDRLIAADPENGKEGWLAIDVGKRDWRPIPLGSGVPPAPGKDYRRGFSLLISAPKLFGTAEALEMCNSSNAHLDFCERLFNETEHGFGRGEVPIFKFTSAEVVTFGKGKSRKLSFEVVKWVKRPEAFLVALAKLEAAASPDKSTGASPDKTSGAAPGDDFDDDAAPNKPKPDDDFSGASASEEEPKPGTTGKAKKARNKAQAEPHTSDILNDEIPYA